jgi:hypothetical protein
MQRHEDEKRRLKQEMQKQRDDMIRGIELEHEKKAKEIEEERMKLDAQRNEYLRESQQLKQKQESEIQQALLN